jgi:hypothetical protein
MNTENFNDGNAEALGTTQVDANQNSGNDAPKVNPGTIRKSQTQSILNALSNAAGTQFESVEAAAAWAARVSALQQLGGSAQPTVEPTQQHSKKSKPDNDLADQFMQLKTDLNRKEQMLREKELDGDIQRTMGDRFDPDLVDYALSKVRSNIQWNDDGTYSIVNTKGQERYNGEGMPFSIADLVEEVARGNPKLLKQNTLRGGSGLRPGQGNFAGAPEDAMPDYSRDPAAFNAWATRSGLGKGVGLKGVGISVSNSATSKKLF